MKFYGTLLASLFWAAAISAQGFSGGFKAGLNFSTFSAADVEVDNDGNQLESFDNTTGFHVAATFAYAFTDLVGVKADLMYTQRGVSRRFEGPSYFYNYDVASGEGILNTGQLVRQQSAVNSYIDIPVMAYYRLGPLEIAGGASAGFLVSSNGTGSAQYTNTIFGDQEVIFSYENNYFRDEAGLGSVVIRGTDPVIPGGPVLPSVVGAYYNNDSDEPLYNRLDFGLVAELNFFLNNGLFVGVRYQHGLSDVTDATNDQQLYLPSGDELVNRDDKDFNRSVQASVGFRF